MAHIRTMFRYSPHMNSRYGVDEYSTAKPATSSDSASGRSKGGRFVSASAETNRPPFDLPEAESELVAGFAVEYSSTPYLLFMCGEYLNIVLMCAMASILFFGGWLPLADVWPLNAVPGVIWLLLKIWFFFFLFAMVKAIVPRYRYDQLMRLGWKVILPISLLWVVVSAGYLFAVGRFT